MSYFFKQHETLNEGLRRIGTEQIQKAVEKLQNTQAPIDQRIHAARKHGKKIRALLRLVRPGMEDIYKQENANIRDACKLLAPLRDADAMQANLCDMIDQETDENAGKMLENIAEQMATHFEQKRENINQEELIQKSIDMFNESLNRVEDWQISSKTPSKALYKGLKKTLKRASKAMDKAYDEPTGPNFHEWRKRVKYHRYHVRLLKHAWLPLLNPLRKELHVVSNFLGDEHDLTVLMEQVETMANEGMDEKLASQSNEYFDNHRLELRDEIRPLALRVFCEKPKHLAKRLSAYHEIWTM